MRHHPKLLVACLVSTLLLIPCSGAMAQDGGYDIFSGVWLKAVLKTPSGEIPLKWREVGTDTTPASARVVSGYFYADPADFAYGSQYNPEIFIKLYNDPGGWTNIAFNHVTVDDVEVSSAYPYAGAPQQTDTISLESRIVTHTYTLPPYDPADDDTPDDTDYTAAVETATDVSQEIALLMEILSNAYSTQGSDALVQDTEYDNNGCPLVTLDWVPLNSTLTIAYNDGCTVDGIPISGTVSGSWLWVPTQGLDVDLTLADLTVDGETVTGTLSISGSAVQGSQVTIDAAITFTDGSGGYTLTLDGLTVAVEINGTPSDPSDDVYTLNGSGSYTDADGVSYTITFTNVVAAFGCYVPVSGTAAITSSDGAYNATVDFGNGACDTAVTIQIGPYSQSVDLAALSS